MSGFITDYSGEEPTTKMVLRTDPWALAPITELQRLGVKHLMQDVPLSMLRREMRALEQSRGLPDGRLLADLRGGK